MVSQTAKPWLKTNAFLGSYWSEPPDAPRVPCLPSILWQKTCTCTIERPIEHLKHFPRAPVTRHITQCLHLFHLLFTILYQPPPTLWWNRSKDFDASATLIHSNVLKLKNVFLKWITGILHMSLPNNLRQSTFWIVEQMLFAHFCDSMVYQTPSVHDYSTMN